MLISALDPTKPMHTHTSLPKKCENGTAPSNSVTFVLLRHTACHKMRSCHADAACLRVPPSLLMFWGEHVTAKGWSLLATAGSRGGGLAPDQETVRP
jgi:hypothetical protein